MFRKTLLILLTAITALVVHDDCAAKGKAHHKNTHQIAHKANNNNNNNKQKNKGHAKKGAAKKRNNNKQHNRAQPKKQAKVQNNAAVKVNNVAGKQFQKQAEIRPQISQNAVTHIQKRHWFNAQQGPNTSHFDQNMTIQKLNKLATTTINNGSKRPSTHGQGRSTYQYKFSHPVGTGTNGQAAYSLRVVADQNHNVITAFPVN